MAALALNIVLSSFCDCAADVDEHATAAISRQGDAHQTGDKGHHQDQPGDNDLYCKCCGTVALNSVNAPPLLALPAHIVWRNSPRIVVADKVAPRPRRHIIEPPRGPPFGA